MTLPIIKSAWDLFQAVPTEDFTSKLMKGIAMFDLLKEEDYDKKDYERLLWLRDNTHVDVMTSVYELDRYVDATQGKFSNTTYTINDTSFTQNKLQYYLCIAIEEVHQIIYKTFKKFKMEIAINLDNDINEEGDMKW